MWLKELDQRRAEAFLGMPRRELGQCMQWITGFCNLMRHKSLKRPRANASCRKCSVAEETLEHISFECEEFRELGVRCFKTYGAVPQSWEPKEM